MAKAFPAAIIFALTLSLAPSLSQAKTVVNRIVKFYPISGTTTQQLLAEIDQAGPTDGNDGQRVWALTKWRVSWRYLYRISGGRCRITSVKTTVKITITLPRWANRAAGPASLQASWKAMIKALARHENRHGENGINAGFEVDRAIAAMASHKKCKNLTRAANALGKKIVKKHANRDIKFDRDTHHGSINIPALNDRGPATPKKGGFIIN